MTNIYVDKTSDAQNCSKAGAEVGCQEPEKDESKVGGDFGKNEAKCMQVIAMTMANESCAISNDISRNSTNLSEFQRNSESFSTLYEREMSEHQAAVLNYKALPHGVRLLPVDEVFTALQNCKLPEPVQKPQADDFRVKFGNSIPTSRQLTLMENKMRTKHRHGAASSMGYQGSDSSDASYSNKKNSRRAQKALSKTSAKMKSEILTYTTVK